MLWVKRLGTSKSHDYTSMKTSLSFNSLCGSTSIMLILASKWTGVHFHKCHTRRRCVGSVGASKIGWLRDQRSRQLWRILNSDKVSECCCGSKPNVNGTVTGNWNGEWEHMIRTLESVLFCFFALNARMFFMDVGFCENTWKEWHVAGSPSVTEKIDAFAFDVCPTTQCDRLLWAVSLLLVLVANNLSVLSFPIILLPIAVFLGVFFYFPSGKLLVHKKNQSHTTLTLNWWKNLQKWNIALRFRLPLQFCCSFKPSDPSNHKHCLASKAEEKRSITSTCRIICSCVLLSYKKDCDNVSPFTEVQKSCKWHLVFLLLIKITWWIN